jgi:hypothetical protein
MPPTIRQEVAACKLEGFKAYSHIANIETRWGNVAEFAETCMEAKDFHFTVANPVCNRGTAGDEVLEYVIKTNPSCYEPIPQP